MPSRTNTTSTKKTTPSKDGVKTSAKKASSASRNAKQTPTQNNIFQKALRAFVNLLSSSRIALISFITILLVIGLLLFDGISNYGKAYSGVSVHGLEVGGMNAEEIRNACEDEFSTRMGSAGITILSDLDELSFIADRALPEDLALYYYGEQEERKTQWATDSAALQASIDYESLAEEAVSAGKGNFIERLSLLFQPKDLDISINFNEAILESLAQQIDKNIGYPLENYNVEVVGGQAQVTLGHDGEMVDRQDLKDKLSEQLLSTDTQNRSFVIYVKDTPVQISKDTAQKTADVINNAISKGIQFQAEGASWYADSATLGSWIQTAITQNSEGNWQLSPSFSLQQARSDILSHIPPQFTNGKAHIHFAKEGSSIQVTAASTGIFPAVGEALEELNMAFFSKAGSTSSAISYQDDQTPVVQLESSDIPSSMTLKEALSCGIVSPIATFTTEFTAGAAERTHNIQLAADLLNESIVPAEGGIWSFNDIAGECNEEKGFQSARVITGNMLEDDIGGGICQVATTVFNAVYEAGYPITERHNHSVYIASYPQGRDAAISWPAPDFKWKNNTDSDILLVMSYTDSSVTATLYGEDMGYEVESEEGEWIEGAEYTTVYEEDDTLSPGYEYVQTYGENGHSISVSRTVRDSEGTIILQDTFPSIYKAQPMVIVRGVASSAEDALDSMSYT